jgi:hypothetical protein
MSEEMNTAQSKRLGFSDSRNAWMGLALTAGAFGATLEGCRHVAHPVAKAGILVGGAALTGAAARLWVHRLDNGMIERMQRESAS